MEVTLLLENGEEDLAENLGFNPCFYGSYSFTHFIYFPSLFELIVLILVFMEVTLLLK